MGNPAARLGDMMKQDTPHCHAPIHPPAPTPTPVPHPALPLANQPATVRWQLILDTDFGLELRLHRAELRDDRRLHFVVRYFFQTLAAGDALA